jgi:hypothetical protein
MPSGTDSLSPVYSRRKGERKRGKILKRTLKGSVLQSLCWKCGAKLPKELRHSECASEGATKSFTGASWSRSINTSTAHANNPPESAQAKIVFEGAFGIIDIMQDDDWQVVQQVLGCWIQTMCMGSARWLCAGSGQSIATERCGPRRQDPHWLRKRKRPTR